MKALVISVGTGTSAEKRATKSVAGAIAYSIKHHNPDFVFFVVSRQSGEYTLPMVLEAVGFSEEEYMVFEVEDPDNVQSIYENLNGHFNTIRSKFDSVVVDYTSGTKAMTAALAMLATLYDVEELSYIAGKREVGIVQPGTEKIVAVRPYFATAERRMEMAVQLFNRSQFEAAISVLMQICRSTSDPAVLNRLKPLLLLAKAYALWDRFTHRNAFRYLLRLKISSLNQNKRFLGLFLESVKKGAESEPYLIADLLNNAERRAKDEHKYDDAVARLYRTVELIAQYLLRRKCHVDPSDVDVREIPHELMSKWGISLEAKRVRLGLEMDYQLLEIKGYEIGRKYAHDDKLKDLLSKRNMSILAHGLQSVDKQTYTQLHNKVVEYAKMAVPNLK
ncbi:MAG: TIGR02710 family CRISPR-associated CARF protein, partial [Candidatus Bathyarchaeia archaeon]